MTDSEEVEERVLALLRLLKKKEDAKIKEVGDEIGDAAWDNEPWFEPDQIMEMFNLWLDACIAGRDDEVLQYTAKALRFSKVEEFSHKDLPKVLKKISQALAKPGAPHMETLLLVQFTPMKFTGDVNLYPALKELLAHEKADIIKDALDQVTGSSFIQLNELPDAEVAEIFKMTVAHAKLVKADLPKYKPGDTDSSARLRNRLSWLNNLFQGAYIFCTMLTIAGKDFPKSPQEIAVPTLVMELKDSVEALKPKPKEQELKEMIKQFVDSCTNLLSYMPKPAAGSADPYKDAQAYLKALGTAKDSNSLNGTMKMMMNSTDKKVLDLLFSKDALETLFKAIQRVKKQETDELYRTFPVLMKFVGENRPAALEAVGDKLLELYMPMPLEMATPKPFIDVMIDQTPNLAKKFWSKVDVWMKSVKSAKGGPMYESVSYAATHAVEGMPRALEEKDLEDFCRKMKEWAELGKGTSMEDTLKSAAIVAIRSVLSRDKSRIPANVLDWIKEIKTGDGYSRSSAEAFVDAYEGRTLEGAYEQINALNTRFKEACVDMESLKQYVDENVSDLKDFIASVAKKLPMPVKFTTEEKFVVKKAILLHFECQAPIRTRYCALQNGKTYTTETLEWSRWLKMGLSAAKLGKSVLTADAIADLPGVVDQVKGLYNMYTKEDGEDFLSFISEPFLTSEEQDKLLNQLRAANFFQKFQYDNQTANWICANCHAIYLKAGSNRSEAGIEAASSHPEVELPFPSLSLGQEGATAQERAENAMGAALEVKKTTMACCSLFGMNLCTSDGDELQVN